MSDRFSAIHQVIFHGRSNTVASGMTRNGDTEFYDGVIELEKAWNEGLKPDPMLLVSECNSKHMSDRFSAIHQVIFQLL
jgi:hypothetical protein